MNVRALVTLIALSLPTAALAGARQVPEYDMTDAETALKSAKKLKFTTEGKAKDYPKKVAIGFFNARYVFKEVSADKKEGVTTVTTLRFDDEQYTYLTDELYGQLKSHLEAQGFKVVDQEKVLNAKAYQALKADDDVKGNKKRVRYAPSGMKNLPTFRGAPKNPGDMAALNAELGTDAIVSGFVSIGICTVEPTKKTEMRSGVYACIKGDMTMPGINVAFFGGTKGEGDKVKPAWTARWFKAYEPYDYNKKERMLFDTAIVSRWAAGRTVNRGFWKAKGLNGDEQAFVGGSQEIWHDALTMGWETWDSKMKGDLKRTKAPGPWELPEPAASPSAAPKTEATGEVPALPGETTCWVGNARVGGNPIGEVLFRRGVSDTEVVEDSVTLMEGQPPYRYVTTLALDGGKFTAKEAAGTWTGEGTYEDGWNAWTVELKMGNGMLVSSTGSVADDTLTIQSQTKDADGKVMADSVTKGKQVDEAACNERFKEIAVPEGAF